MFTLKCNNLRYLRFFPQEPRLHFNSFAEPLKVLAVKLQLLGFLLSPPGVQSTCKKTSAKVVSGLLSDDNSAQIGLESYYIRVILLKNEFKLPLNKLCKVYKKQACKFSGNP